MQSIENSVQQIEYTSNSMHVFSFLPGRNIDKYPSVAFALSTRSVSVLALAVVAVTVLTLGAAVAVLLACGEERAISGREQQVLLGI